MSLSPFVADGDAPRPLHLVTRDTLAAWRERQPQAAWIAANGFDAAPGSALVLPGAEAVKHEPLPEMPDAHVLLTEGPATLPVAEGSQTA